MFDRLPPMLRDLVFLLGPPLLGWAASDAVPWLHGQGGVWGVIAGVLAQVLLIVTPATRRYGTGRHAVRPGDAGVATPFVAVAVVVVASLLWVAMAVLGGGAEARVRRGPVMPRAVVASNCGGVLAVTFELEILVGREMQLVLDDSRERVEVLEVSSRSGPAGRWTPVAAVFGGEGRLRWPGLVAAGRSGQHYGKARVVRTDADRVVSVPVPIVWGCPR